MTVVKINAIEVPEGAGAELEKRFAARAGAVENSPGFEGFQLLRPVEGESRYFVMTWWESEEAFQGWMNSQDFARGHANAGGGPGGGHPGGEAPKPVATGSSLLGFEVVERVDPK
jgi:heme oxygenase (mycobilin-producing)